LQSLNPSVDEALLQTMNNVNEAFKIYDNQIREAIEKVFDPGKGVIDIHGLQALPSPESVLFELLKEYGFGRERVHDIARAVESQSGKEFYSPYYVLIKDRNRFLLLPREPESTYKIYEIGEKNTEIHEPVSMRITTEIVHDHFEIRKEKQTAYFDAAKIRFPLHIRKWEKGDKLVPFGMNHFQKISDYFNNHKFSKPEKENTWLLCSGNDILWIIGHRTDNRFRMDKDTQKAIILKLF
jgi:tRNA(Ile)-lysidine synthase